MWGGLTLLRTSNRTAFTPAETDLVEGLAGPLAEGVRRSILAGGSPAPVAAPPERPPLDPASDAAGLVLLGPDNSVAGANDAAQVWLAELQEGRTGRALPPVVTGVVSRARGIGDGSGGSGARARVRTAAGTWLVVRALTTGADPQAQVAVILEPARSTELAALLADLLGLTARERAVTELVAQGLPTSAIAARLHLSPWTVQDHLKAVFDKTATSTRGELVARLYFDHGAPRLTTDPPLTASGAPGS
jgi:DNA-binding CsgD family transcriptional regulator